jgi:hypothetical protein
VVLAPYPPGGGFVTRLRHDARYEVLETRPLPQKSHIGSDQLIGLGGHWYRQKHPLRRIAIGVPASQEPVVLLTNHLTFGATTISRIYQDR